MGARSRANSTQSRSVRNVRPSVCTGQPRRRGRSRLCTAGRELSAVFLRESPTDRLTASASASGFRCRPRRRPSARTLGPPCGREFRPIRTRWREISAEIAVFPPSASQTTVSRSHPESLGSSHRHPDAIGPPCAPSPVPQSPSAVPRSRSALHAGGSFGRSAPDGGRFPLKLQFSLLRRRQVKATAGGVRSAVPRSKAPASAVQGHH